MSTRRLPSRQQGAEAEQQHDDGRAEADGGREAEARLLGLLDRLAAQLDLQRRRARRLGAVDHALDRSLGQLVRPLVELDRGEADRAVLGKSVCAGRVRPDDAGDMREPPDPPQQRRDDGACRGVAELARAGPEDDLVDVACLRREAALEQVDRALRVGVREREVVRVARSYRLRGGKNTKRERDPGENDDPAVSDGPASELQHLRAPIQVGNFTLSNFAFDAESSQIGARDANMRGVQD